MTASQNVENLLSQYANEAGLGSIALDDNHLCALTYDDRHTVNFAFYEDDSSLVLVASLGDLPSGNNEELVKTMLEANAPGFPTLGSALGINLEERIFTLTRTLCTESLDYQTFVRRLNQFVEQVQEWRNILGNAAHEQQQPSALSTEPSSSHLSV